MSAAETEMWFFVHENKAYLHDCLAKMRDYIENERKMQFNQKTQIFPHKNGVEYLGFRFSLSKSGAVNGKTSPVFTGI